MRWEVAINIHESIEDTLDIATRCDEAGIDQIWVVDYPAPRFAPAVATKIAAQTSIRIGIGVISPLIYSTEHIVRFMDTLLKEFGDRFDLLIGPGDRSALQRIGQRTWIPKQIVEEVVTNTEIIRNDLRELGNTGCDIFLAAQGPRMIANSKRTDGVLLNYTDPEMIKWALEQLGEKSDISHQTGVFVPSLIIGETQEPPPQDILYSAAIVALGAPSKVIDALSLHEIKKARTILGATGKITSEIIESMGVNFLKRWGLYSTPQSTMEYISILEGLEIDRVVYGPPLAHSTKSIDLLVEVFKLYKSRSP